MGNTKSREDYILYLLEMRYRVSTEELCEILGLTASTIRRQLQDMENRGLLIRSHGGAVSVDAGREPTIQQKATMSVKEKRAIASVARNLIRDGDVIALGGGSTVLELCQLMLDLKNVIVLTNSIAAANILLKNPSIELWISGGIVNNKGGYIVGPNAEGVFSHLTIEKAFLGTEAIDFEKGIFSATFGSANVEKAIAKMSKRIYVMADSSKINRESVVLQFPLSAIHSIITDDSCPEEYVQILEKKGVEVLLPSQHNSSGKRRWAGH